MSVFRIEKDKDNPYVMLNKSFLNDENLSWKAKGLLSYILSLPDDWQIYETELTTHSRDKRDSTRSAVKELISNGYIVKGERFRDEKGHLKGNEYTVFETPHHVGKSNIGFSNIGKSYNTNKSTRVNNDKSNTSTHLDSSRSNHGYIKHEDLPMVSQVIVELYEEFFHEPHRRITKIHDWAELDYGDKASTLSELRYYFEETAQEGLPMEVLKSRCTVDYINAIEGRWR